MPADFLFLIPPMIRSTEPAIGTACLCSFLNSRNIKASTVDLNLMAGPMIARNADDSTNHRIHRAVLHLEKSLKSLVSPALYLNASHYRSAVEYYSTALRAAGAGQPWKLTPGDYTDDRFSGFDPCELEPIFNPPVSSPFDPCFQQFFNHYDSEPPRYAGLSVTYRSQFIPALFLMKMMKVMWPDTQLLWGGALTGCLPETTREWLTTRLDHLVSGAGEIALSKIFNIELSPAVFFSDPVFETQNLNDYFSPGRVIPVMASRGCYWHRCAFCSENKEPFFCENQDHFISRLIRLKELYAPDLFHLTDNAVPPSILECLATHDHGCRWFGFVRAEGNLTDLEFTRALGENGCRMLEIGIETASQKWLDQLNKNIQISDVVRVLRNLRSSNIKTYGYFLFGFPGQTLEDCEETLDFINRNPMDFINASIFQLPSDSMMIQHPEKHGIQSVHLRENGGLYFDYESEGIDRRTLRNWMSTRFYRSPAVRKLVERTPKFYKSNHAVYF